MTFDVECIDQLSSTFSDKTLSLAPVKRWYNDFNRGQGSLTDDIHEFREISFCSLFPIPCEIEGTLGFSSTSIYKILRQHLTVRKVCSCWNPHKFTKYQKDARVVWCTNAQEVREQ
ncbi:uncharacterized protein LOC119673937 [Teleopsis dalmanni]|uniref:uncharacterized protein LOC119673937 n=1 Tax=Teleopsis dalmanni TaxID=139649 RepID=UPI0018CD590A|nr:uncharacterized protein LOC119673937 [Teleopsis dalmanni]